MNRTSRYKLQYVLILVGMGGPVVYSFLRWDLPATAYFVVALVLLIPGRINGHCWRELYRGRRLLDLGRWREGGAHLERFLVQLKERPWLKSLIWFGWGFYTRDVEAMTHNNLGTVKLNAGDFEGAEREWQRAIELDPLYPIPFHNLALLAQVRENPGRARELLAKSQELGFRSTPADTLAHEAASLLARIEGRPER